MVKQSKHWYRKQEEAEEAAAALVAAEEAEKAATIAARLLHQQKLAEAAAAEAAEAAAAQAELEAARKLARGRGIARLVLTLFGVVLVGAFTFFKEDEVLMTTAEHSFAGVVSEKLDYHLRNVSSWPLPSVEPFDMTQFNRIHLYHIRKAGGSTLRRYLEDVAQHHNLPFSATEGYCYQGHPPHGNKTLMITTVRDPMERAISSYWFEGNVNASNPNSFRDWVDAETTTYARYYDDGRGYFVWQCASNCLTKWFGGEVPGNLAKAKRALQQDFHLVIQQNRMDDVRYKRWISFLLDAPGVRFEHKNKGTHGVHETKNKQAGPTAEDQEYLKEINQQDIELLDYVLPRREDLDGYIIE